MKKVPYILLAAALVLSAALSFAPSESQAATCIRLTRDLERGMKGNDVLQVQAFLVEQGFLSSTSFNAGAGEYGPRTVTSVRAFQSSVGINATGYIGPVTRQALTNATCGTTTSTSGGGGGGGGGPANNLAGPGTPIVIGGSSTGLSVSLRTERANNTFSQVDSIRMYVTVHNSGASAFPLTFPTTCQVSYTIGTTFNFADWRTCQQAPATVTITPNGGSFTWEVTYTPVTFGQLPVGTKTLRATVGNYGSDELSLTITPIQPGQQPPVVTPQGTEPPTTPVIPTVGGGPVVPEQSTPIIIGGSPTGLTVLTQTDRANNTFRQTDIIRMTVTVRNTNATAYTLNFPTTCQASYTISPSFNINDWRSCPSSTATRTIPAGGSYTWDLAYYPATLGQLSTGTKTLRGTVGNYGGDNLTLTITPLQTTQGPVNTNPNNTNSNTPTSPVGSVPQDQNPGPQESGPTGVSFPIFDDIAGYAGEPSPTFLPGLTEMCGSYTYSFFPQNNTTVPSEQITRNTVRNLPPTCKYFVIDIEHLPYDIRHDTYPYPQVNATIQKFNSIIAWIRSERPDLKIGFYGVLPVPVYWEIQNYVGSLQSNEPWWVAQRPAFAAEYLKWQQANNYLSTVASRVDFIGPTLYDPYPNSMPGWRNLAEKTIQEANRYNKPVYPFLWFRVNNVEHGYAPLSPGQMRQQFEGVKQYGADGMIIWDYGYGAPWPNFNWIPELQSFINANNINPTLPASALNAVNARGQATTAAYILAAGFTLIFFSLVLLGLTVFKKKIRRGR